jgi:EAL domain-containing protein
MMALSDAAPALLESIPIETDEHLLRARRTAAITRILMGMIGSGLVLGHPHLAPRPTLALIGFTTILITTVVQFVERRHYWLSVEESVSGAAGVLIIGFGSERVSILSMLWLVAIASGVLARGGRVHWLGRYLVLAGLLLPVARYGELSVEYAALCAGTVGLLLTSGRLTRELNHLLKEARQQADSAETLLLAGDIAARIVDHGERSPADAPSVAPALVSLDAEQKRDVLERMIAGEGVAMAAQPIVDLRSGSVHAYELLARFQEPRGDGSPLRWFSLAEELGRRAALERTCLALALELFARRPPGVGLSVNLSAPVLLDPATLELITASAERQRGELDGLIIEITEETLVHSDTQLSRHLRVPACARSVHGGRRHGRRLLGAAPDHDRLPQLPEARPLAGLRDRQRRRALGPRRRARGLLKAGRLSARRRGHRDGSRAAHAAAARRPAGTGLLPRATRQAVADRSQRGEQHGRAGRRGEEPAYRRRASRRAAPRRLSDAPEKLDAPAKLDAALGELRDRPLSLRC